VVGAPLFWLAVCCRVVCIVARVQVVGLCRMGMRVAKAGVVEVVWERRAGCLAVLEKKVNDD
jgi:hypothetical protein